MQSYGNYQQALANELVHLPGLKANHALLPEFQFVHDLQVLPLSPESVSGR